VSYVLVVLCVVAACVLWYLLQRWAGLEAAPTCGDAPAECGDCPARETDCGDGSES
jgi:hypothetical protein